MWLIGCYCFWVCTSYVFYSKLKTRLILRTQILTVFIMHILYKWTLLFNCSLVFTMFIGLMSSATPATAHPASFFTSVLTCIGHSGGGLIPVVLMLRCGSLLSVVLLSVSFGWTKCSVTFLFAPEIVFPIVVILT